MDPKRRPVWQPRVLSLYPLQFITLGEQDALAEVDYVVIVGVQPVLGSSSEEVPMNWNKWIRQFHRWVSIAFTVTVIANIVIMAQGKIPLPWVTYSPLVPLGLLLLTGLYLFVLPYAGKWRGGRRTET